MQVIIGSTALQKYGYSRRIPKDVDIMTDEPLQSSSEVDYIQVPTEVLEFIPVNSDGVATPCAVYTIKCSHLGWEQHPTSPAIWDKHKLDIIYLRNRGCEIIPELYNALVEHWKSVFGSKEYLSLSQNKEDFFTDNVAYYIDHDLLHEWVAYPNNPVYTHCLKDNEDVLIDKDKFDKLSFEQQVRMFREEISVITLERFLIPDGNYQDWYKNYSKGLKKTIISLTKGWACDFIVCNLDKFIKPDYSYFKYPIQKLTEEK